MSVDRSPHTRDDGVRRGSRQAYVIMTTRTGSSGDGPWTVLREVRFYDDGRHAWPERRAAELTAFDRWAWDQCRIAVLGAQVEQLRAALVRALLGHPAPAPPCLLRVTGI